MLVTFFAFVVRVWGLDMVPPGWRDDELINALVISQKALDGDLAVYYPDASGHEGLYHILVAGFLAIFGRNEVAIRGVSVILGTLTVPLTYVVGTRLFNRRVGLFAAACLSLSFWSLMYSRTGIRHVSAPLFALAAVVLLWQGFRIHARWFTGTNASDGVECLRPRLAVASFGLAGLFVGIGFYTYFASRGVLLVLLAFALYLGLFKRALLRRHLRNWLLLFGVAAALALPLLVTLRQQPESEARVSELAVPLLEARAGDYRRLVDHVVRTLGMFHSSGDDEWLYNIPHRPVFGPLGALFFWSGVAIAGWSAMEPVRQYVSQRIRRHQAGQKTQSSMLAPAAAAFVLIWWLVGISPAFVSVPPASLGHTILAQPVTFVLAALPVSAASTLLERRSLAQTKQLSRAPVILGLILLAGVAARDLPDYFVAWPNRGMTRFLYRADIAALAHYLDDHPELMDFGVTGLLAGPWDKLALEIDLGSVTEVRPRWHNPERVVMLQLFGKPALAFNNFPSQTQLAAAYYDSIPGHEAGGFRLSRAVAEAVPASEPLCFQNGLCLLEVVYNPDNHILKLTWQVSQAFQAPLVPLVSSPPPPGVYTGPRLSVFTHLLDSNSQLIAGDDGLWVDPATLYPGDVFLQQHDLPAPDGMTPASISFGLYDPMTGNRIRTEAGQEQVRMDLSR